MTVVTPLVSKVASLVKTGISQAGAWGGVFELEQFQVTDNGGEPFQVDDEFATPEDFMVRA